MVPWIYAQIFGTFQTIFLTATSVQLSVKIILIIFLELASIYHIFTFYKKISTEKLNANALTYQEFVKGLERSDPPAEITSKLRFQYNRTILLNDSI